ncbi:MAG TPA: inner membrane CreD family protein [Terriglobales bacterium]|nr:inner membrane CreD family protein [Terriglobales bacterium]
MIKHIAALVFIFVCTSIAWIILGSTIMERTNNSGNQLRGRVASTWGSEQEQIPPTATFAWYETVATTTTENGKTVIHYNQVERKSNLQLDSTRVKVDLDLNHRQKGLLWYSTYAVDFDGDYSFHNNATVPGTVTLRLPFPAQRAVYDGLAMTFNGQPVTTSIDDTGAASKLAPAPGQTALLHVAYRSHGMDRWRYKLAEGVAQVHDFSLVMHTNFKGIDFADDTLSPTAKKETADGWELDWRYSDLVSGFQIGMEMPEKLQPGPLAGEISYFAPVSLFFFFFLMFIITTLRGIDLHPMNYFFLAAAFFAFHLLLAYLVDHISIHAAMAISSVVSIFLVVSYLRLVAGIRFAALEAGTAQLIYLVVFSYAFFWKGFTGLTITVISVITLFIVMQTTGKIRWSDKFARRPEVPGSSI